MDRLQMAQEALVDFKKFKSSKKCRHYKNIIHFLRTIPSGFNNQNKINEFKDFLPIEMRRGIRLEKVVELILQFYIGYSEAMKDTDVRKCIRRIWAKKYYKKNKEKVRKRQLEYQRNNKDKISILGKKYKQKNKEKIKLYQKKYRQKNKEKLREYRQKSEVYRFYLINKRRMSKGLDPIL